MHLICTAARKDDVFFAYLVAIPRQRFNVKNAFSTQCRNLYNSLSYSRWTFLFLRGGITAFIPPFSAFSTIVSESYPRSAKSALASMPSINSSAWLQSAVVPFVIEILTGTPCASTARCILVLSPLLSWPCPDCPREHHFRAHEL
ncbi:hypothetical protein SDC9_150341 [bioreactor metagenome]|uniref:Uncharacterized protein n=1 Tax=bioreactor metagenome TaxID=1076179 RepID=A0A645EM73_9ZZZZ